jgi:iron complex transport system substrate-binding protein
LHDVEQAVSTWLDSRPLVVSLQPNTLADVWADIQHVADALGISARGRNLVGQLRARMDAAATQVGRLPQRPTVACIEWIDPLMAAGNWLPELVHMAGGVNLFGTAGKHSPWLTWDTILAQDPDVIVVLPCGYNLAATRREMVALTRKPDWSQLRAVRNRHVYLTDGNQYFNRPGPRLVESLEILAELLHPKECTFCHERTGWERL